MITDARFYGNEYFVKYSELIEVRTNDRLEEGSPETEVHHIVPGSIGGSDDNSNLVVLKTSEHYFAHYLLAMAFITNDPNSAEAKKMAFAWDNISNFKRFKRTLLPKFSKKDAKDYAKIKEIAKKVYSDPEYRKSQLEGLRAWHADPENKRLASQRSKKNWENPDFRKKMKELVKTDEWKKRQRAGAIKVAKDPEWKRKVQEACIARNKDPEYRKRRLEGIRRACGMKASEGDDIRKKEEWRKHILQAAEKRKNENVEWRKNNAALMKRLHEDPDIRKKATENMMKAKATRKNDPAYVEAMHKKFSEAAKKRMERIKSDPSAYAAYKQAMKNRSARQKADTVAHEAWKEKLRAVHAKRRADPEAYKAYCQKYRDAYARSKKKEEIRNAPRRAREEKPGSTQVDKEGEMNEGMNQKGDQR